MQNFFALNFSKRPSRKLSEKERRAIIEASYAASSEICLEEEPEEIPAELLDFLDMARLKKRTKSRKRTTCASK